MADKNMNGSTEAERAADPDRAPQHPRKGLHDALQDTPVKSKVASALMTSTKGNARKAKIKLAPGRVSANGNRPPPK